MFCLWLTQRRVAKYLSEPIRKWRWDPLISEAGIEPAKSALKETLRRAKSIFPRSHLVFIGQHNYPLHDNSNKYLLLLIKFDQAMLENRWNDACNTLLDMIQSFHIEDRRILNEIIHLMETRLK